MQLLLRIQRSWFFYIVISMFYRFSFSTKVYLLSIAFYFAVKNIESRVLFNMSKNFDLTFVKSLAEFAELNHFLKPFV
jgi:hypothetical protein